MNIITILIMIGVSLYTIGFSIQLWKEDSKIGAISVLILSLAIVITPFFSVLR